MFNLEDIFQFLELFTLNPLSFLEKLLSFIFNDWQMYINNFHDDIIKNLLKDYVSTSFEKQLVITVGNFKYELFKFLPNGTYEENITKTINDFPIEDPVDILGFNVNNEFQFNYLRSMESMKFLREFYRNYAKIQEKCEIESKIIDSLIYEKDEIYVENFSIKYENVLYLLQEMNFTTSLKNRLKLIESLLELVSENIYFRSLSTNEATDPYIDEETIKEWFQDHITEENQENSSPITQFGQFLEVITFKKLHLSLKRNTSLRSSIRKMSKVFAMHLLPAVSEESEVKSSMYRNRSKFSVATNKNASLSSGIKEIPKNNVIFLYF